MKLNICNSNNNSNSAASSILSNSSSSSSYKPLPHNLSSNSNCIVPLSNMKNHENPTRSMMFGIPRQAPQPTVASLGVNFHPTNLDSPFVDITLNNCTDFSLYQAKPSEPDQNLQRPQHLSSNLLTISTTTQPHTAGETLKPILKKQQPQQFPQQLSNQMVQTQNQNQNLTNKYNSCMTNCISNRMGSTNPSMNSMPIVQQSNAKPELKRAQSSSSTISTPTPTTTSTTTFCSLNYSDKIPQNFGLSNSVSSQQQQATSKGYVSEQQIRNNHNPSYSPYQQLQQQKLQSPSPTTTYLQQTTQDKNSKPNAYPNVQQNHFFLNASPASSYSASSANQSGHSSLSASSSSSSSAMSFTSSTNQYNNLANNNQKTVHQATQPQPSESDIHFCRQFIDENNDCMNTNEMNEALINNDNILNELIFHCKQLRDKSNEICMQANIDDTLFRSILRQIDDLTKRIEERKTWVNNVFHLALRSQQIQSNNTLAYASSNVSSTNSLGASSFKGTGVLNNQRVSKLQSNSQSKNIC